jgi:MFS family permease
MELFAVTTYEISVFIHITAVVVGFGATFAEAIMFPVAMQVGIRHLPYVHRLQLAINQRFAGPAIAIVLITGIYQTAESWEFDQFWITAALVIILVLGGLIGGYFIPADRKLGPMVESELANLGPGDVSLSDLSEEYQRRGRMEGIVGGIAGLLVVIAIYLMVTKPGV